MTLLNVAVGPQEFAFAADSLLSGWTSPLQIAKQTTLPHWSAAVASLGAAGLGANFDELLGLNALLATDFEDLLGKSPAALRGIWTKQRHSGDATLVYIGGIVRERAIVAALRSPDFEVERLPAGTVLLHPAPDPIGAPASLAESHARAVLAAREPAPARPFRDCLAAITSPVRQQAGTSPTTCGGPVVVTYVDSGGIRQWQLLDLDAEP